MKKLKNIHPGEILQEEFLIPLGLSAYKLSKDVGIPRHREGFPLCKPVIPDWKLPV